MRTLRVPLVFLAVGVSAGQQVFTEVSTILGISGQTGLGHSVAWADFDNDGHPDLAISNQDGSGFWLYRNVNGQFADVTFSAGLSGLGAYRIIWSELTGDGLTDLVLVRSSTPWLFRNNGDLTFTNVTSGSGLAGSALATGDFNNDGHTDILCSVSGSGVCVYHNQGSGVFTQAVVSTGTYWVGVAIDYNSDGHQDIYLGTYGTAPNVLLRNNGNGTFSDVTASAGVEWGGGTSGIAVGDYDNNGWPDIYLGNTSAPGCKLFSNLGNGTFTDVTSAAGVTGYADTRTVSFVDYNNDGWLDIFVSNHDFYSYSNQMYRNNSDGTFSEVGVSLGLSGQWMGDYFGVGWSDFDHDGDMDLFAAGHIDKYNLFRNDMGETVPGNFLVVSLEGTTSNRNAIGARVQAQAGPLAVTRQVFGGQGKHDFHDFSLHFGLYDTEWVDMLTVTWPSGTVQSFCGIAGNQHIHLVEGDTLGTEEETFTEISSSVLRVSPNPSGPQVSFHFSGVSGGNAELTVHDLSGRLVRVLYAGPLWISPQMILWDGTDGGRRSMPAGVYLCRLSTSVGSVAKIFTLLR